MKRPLEQIPESRDYMVLAEDWIENPISTTVLSSGIYIHARGRAATSLRVVILAGCVSRRFILHRIFHL
jgi:hypothetical protein